MNTRYSLYIADILHVCKTNLGYLYPYLVLSVMYGPTASEVKSVMDNTCCFISIWQAFFQCHTDSALQNSAILLNTFPNSVFTVSLHRYFHTHHQGLRMVGPRPHQRRPSSTFDLKQTYQPGTAITFCSVNYPI